MVVFIGTEATDDIISVFIGYSYEPIFIALARYPDSFSIFIGIEFNLCKLGDYDISIFIGFEVMNDPVTESNVFIGIGYGHDGVFTFAGAFRDCYRSSYFFGLLSAVS
jgi:hypothetical protein